MPHALVTGGAGFIGSHLVDYLIKTMDFRVTVLDDLSGGFRENVNPKAAFIRGSITDATLVNTLFSTSSFDYVFHLAAYAAEGLSHFIKRFNYMNNLVGSVNLINASVNNHIKCFVFTSSIAVYGTNPLPYTERMVPHPEDSYGIAKYAVEMELACSHEMWGMPYIIFRPHNVYGERQNIGDKYRNVIGIFMNNALGGRDLVIFGDGSQRRAFTYIHDIIPSIAKSVLQKKSYNNVFNIGTDSHYTVNEVADLVKNVMESSVSIRHVSARKEVKQAFSDHTKFLTLFPDTAQTRLTQGLQAMGKWVKETGVRKSKDFENIEVLDRLPDTWK